MQVNNVRVVVEAVSLLWMESKKELFPRAPKSATSFVTCMEFQEVAVSKDRVIGRS